MEDYCFCYDGMQRSYQGICLGNSKEHFFFLCFLDSAILLELLMQDQLAPYILDSLTK